MNRSQLDLPSAPSVSWSSMRAEETEADFLSLRLLNKRTRIRLSDKPLDLKLFDGQGNYFVVSNVRGWFAAITSGNKLILSPTDHLRTSITSSTTEGEEQLQPKRVLQLSDVPIHLSLASNDERLVISFATGSFNVYDTAMLFSEGSNIVGPLHIFPAASPGVVRQVLANPGDLPDLVAIRRDAASGNDGLVVEIIDVKQLQSVGGWTLSSSSKKDVPTSISWSTKGKQLALGLAGGEIATYSPNDASIIKLHVPRPPAAEGHSVISLLWLSNQSFYGIYAPEGSRDPECTQKHILTSFDQKANVASQTEFEPPYYPSPGLRPPGAFAAVMRSWEPAKLLAFISDSTSSDIGVIGNMSKDGSDRWCNFSLEETSTPGVPLDKDAEDTVPMALEMDLILRPEGQEPNLPILYLYASDGTLQAWYISNTKAGPYPGMVNTSPSVVSTTIQPSPTSPSGAFGTVTSPSAANPTFGAASFGSGILPSGQAGTTTAFGTTSLNQGQPGVATSAFGNSSFGKPAFGQSSFSQSTSVSPFVSSIQAQTQPAFGSSSGGFSAFADNGSKFGQTSAFGVNNSLKSSTSSQSKPEDTGPPEAEMTDENDAGDNFGGLSLGDSAASTSAPEGATNKMFGSFAQSPPTPQQASSSFESGTTSKSFGAFGSTAGSSFLKPASGFGAFGSKPPENKQGTAALPATPKPASAFVQSGFASTTPAFGQTSFGQPSAFGRSTFGQSGIGNSTFGAPATPTPSSTATSSGGFGAFAGASKGFSSFAQNGSSASAFGQLASTMSSKASESPSIAMASSTDTIAPKSAISEDKPDAPFSAFGKKDPSTPMPFGKPATSISGSTTPAGSPFGSFQNSNMMGGKDALKASVDGKPMSFTTPDRSGSMNSSPENSPVMGRMSKIDELTSESPNTVAKDLPSTPSVQSTTPFGTPASSIFGNTGTTSPGAFGNLKTTRSAFGPAQGFGAFGSGAKLPTSSPFANPKPAGLQTSFATPGKPVSAFSSGGVGPASTTPTFGTPSTPGGSSLFGKASFGTPATPTPTSTTPLGTPSGSAFSAFSNAAGGFSAFAKADKSSSFSDLLKQGDDAQASKNNEDEKVASAAKQVARDDESNLVSGLSRTESSFVSVSKPEDFDQDNLPPTPSTHGTFDQEEQEIDEDDHRENDDAESFLSESFEGSEEEEDSEEGDERKAEEDDDADAVDNDDDASRSEEEEEGQEHGEVEEEQEDEGTPSSSKEQTPQPGAAVKEKGIEKNEGSEASIPLESKEPKSSETPPPSLPGNKTGTSIPTLFGRPITSGQAPAEPAKSSGVNNLMGGKAPALTPPIPVSPELQHSEGKESKPLLAPTPINAPSNTPAFGLGRPSSRPTRSSPLAGSPVPGEKGSEVAPASTIGKPRPASPKTPFGQLPVGSKPASSFVMPSAPGMSSTAQQKPSVFGATPVSQPSPMPGAFSFGSPKPKASPPLPSSSGSAQSPLSHTVLGAQAQSAHRQGATMGPPKTVQHANTDVSQQQQTAAAQATFQSSMQRECQSLYVDMQKELDFLGKVAQVAASTRMNLGKPARTSHTKDDLGEKTKWTFGDLDGFAQLLKHIEKTVILANKLKDQFTPLMRELEGDQLKAETLKEEIIRFSKAKADPEFARMLKERTLGPDAAEIQNQLRKHIRLIADRIEQLEGHLMSCRKKVEERRKGKPGLKAPSLDTINRTYRNIDIGIEAQAHQIEDLIRRVSKLNVDALDATLHGSSAPRGQRSSTNREESSGTARWNEKESVGRSQVTPSIAASTAAALNAERNALRLKNALAKARKTPLLNTQATQPVRHTPTIDSLHKQSAEATLDTNMSASTSSNESAHESRSNLERRTSRNTRHVNSVKLGKTHQRVPSSISNFDWGPLPKAAPMTTLPVALIPQPPSNTP